LIGVRFVISQLRCKGKHYFENSKGLDVFF
jgi:hypothetical protein